MKINYFEKTYASISILYFYYNMNLYTDVVGGWVVFSCEVFFLNM